MRQQKTIQCYRVVGGNAQAAGRLCRERAESCGDKPLIAITLERLRGVRPRHVEVCREVIRTAQLLGREIYVCGVTDENRGQLVGQNLLADLKPQRVFCSLRALLDNFADVPRYSHSGKVPPPPDRTPPFGLGGAGTFQGRIK